MNHPAGIDLAQFHAAFFEEAGENLERLEQLLLGLDPDRADDERLNAVFRCAHSVKGGAATFGFGELSALTHRMEALLDRMRRHEVAPTAARIDALLACGDTLRAMLEHRRSGAGAPPDAQALTAQLQALAESDAAPPPPAGSRRLELRLGPVDDAAAVEGVLELFDEIPDLGRIAPLDDGAVAEGQRRFLVYTDTSDAELLDLFAFHIDRSRVQLIPSADAGTTPAPQTLVPAAPPLPPMPPPGGTAAEASTLRVSVEKVERLLDEVGELLVAQSILAQACAALDGPARGALAGPLDELQRHARELQDTVMSVRMVPMAAVYARFPRLVRDLAARMGKRVELVLEGESTELDKGMVEHMVDPLTHLVRNALDHGIEAPAERVARGKPETGTLTLSASHQAGAVVVEVRDDGTGLSRARLLAKARERGLEAPDGLPDAQVWALIFAPGFSTAAEVTDVSGRGVGMDVVQRNIAALGGHVEIDSAEGRGLAVRVHLPLTLAIIDGLTIRLGEERYVLPVAAVIETLRLEDAPPRPVAGRPVVPWRDELLPMLDLNQLLQVPGQDAPAPRPVLVVVEAEGRRAALRLDELLGQQQVVVKSLETHVGPVDGFGGATILGDGRVALIVDVAALMRGASRESGAAAH